MHETVMSLFWIVLVAAAAPLIAGLIPRRRLPEVVVLLVLGVMIGPNVLDWATTDDSIAILRELGLGMLFLLAGYEIDPDELTGPAGRRSLVTWFCCLGIACGVVLLLDAAGIINGQIAIPIALTSTALGTLLPILKDSGMVSTPIGVNVLRHGAFGELGPIVAIAVLLGTSGPVRGLVVLAVFAVVMVALSIPTVRMRSRSTRLHDLIRHGADTTAQTTVRITMLVLVGLAAITTSLDLDPVLAAFAAGFLLRLALPDGEEKLEAKLEGLAFGFLIPIFFITSGMSIDPEAIAENPGVFVAVVLLIALARGVPVFISSVTGKRASGGGLTRREGLAVGLYSATGLPIIVAVTSISVDAGKMSETNASILIAAGAATIVAFPLLASLVLKPAEPAPPRSEADRAS